MAGSWDHILVTASWNGSRDYNRGAKLTSGDETECDQAACMHSHAHLSLDSCVRKGITLQNVFVFIFHHELHWLDSRFRFNSETFCRTALMVDRIMTRHPTGRNNTKHNMADNVPIARGFYESRLRSLENRIIFGHV